MRKKETTRATSPKQKVFHFKTQCPSKKNPRFQFQIPTTLVSFVPLGLLFTVMGFSLLVSTPCLGYVLLSARKATLPVSLENPTVGFIWDGQSPNEIKEKEKFANGIYAQLDDTAFMEQLLTFALNTWNEVPGAYIKLSFQKAQDPSSVILDSEDGKFSIITEASSNLSTAAFAKPMVESDNPHTIKDCDISIANTATTAQSLAYTIIHELGHCLGLGHSHTNYNAIMGYARSPSGNLKLGADDIAGLIFLYPDPNMVGTKPKDLVCGSIDKNRDTAMGGIQRGAKVGWFLIAPLFMVAMVHAFERRKPSSAHSA